MSNYSEKYVTKFSNGISGPFETLIQCLQIVHDGDLISKSDRDVFVNRGMIIRCNGFNIITAKGIEALEQLYIIHP